MAWTSLNSALRIFSYSRAKALQAGKIHPTQKPVALYKWLLKNYATPDMKIFDSHLGSGSSAIAAWEFKCAEFVGTEIDLDYFNSAVLRFENHIKQLKLF
jgi:site-specific DNA-methyltransferase (adenine-specific)